ncbi:MAG: multicopper oxidase domain-containing protein [Anaeromyxobacteraceae bacterium]
MSSPPPVPGDPGIDFKKENVCVALPGNDPPPVITPAGDFFGPPPPGDPSANVGPFVGLECIELLTEPNQPPANEGSFEGSSHEEVFANNAIARGIIEPPKGLDEDIPTGAPPSPLFGAEPFTQQLLLFEEFGTEPLAPGAVAAFPRPTRGPEPEQDPEDPAKSAVAGPVLEAFLGSPGIAPFPREFSNTEDQNPWRPDIETFLGRPLVAPPAEGRPPGRNWAHQRFNEFRPEIFFKTAQSGARVNGGFRDTRQRHHYAVGEFGPGGLYHRVYSAEVPGAPVIEGTTRGVAVRFHPKLPIQNHKSLWTFDGTLPVKVLQVRVGQPVLNRDYNGLPIDPSANRGFGMHTLTTHEHNGHTPGESDGFTNAFFFPGEYYDYRWPLQLAGYDTINTTASDPRAAFPCEPGETLFVFDQTPGPKPCVNGRIQIRGDWRETMSSHWFHDHMLDFTSQNVYKGNAATMNYYSALDRGKEDLDDGVNLRIASGTALPWGNRDYDVNIDVTDKAWDREGQLFFNVFQTNGFLGDRVATNLLFKPFFEVRARRYRIRILNAAVARFFGIALVHEVRGNGGELRGPPGSGVSFNRVPFHMIANDGNLMEHAIAFDGLTDLDNDGDADEHKGQLPSMGVAERYDILVDFARHGIKSGDRLYFVNVIEHDTGRKTKRKVPLKDILDGTYNPQAVDKDGDGFPDRWEGGDPGVGKFLQFRVRPNVRADVSMDPRDFEPGKRTMIALPIDPRKPADQAKILAARHRTFEFVREGGGTDSQGSGSQSVGARDDLAQLVEKAEEKPWAIKVDNVAAFHMDPRRLLAAPQLSQNPTPAGFTGEGTLEVWSIEGNGGWDHPVHVHFEEGVIISRDGKPPPLWETFARKDIYRIGPDEDSSHNVELAFHIREFAGTYMEHCHNTSHEDHSMLLRWDSEHPGQFKLMPAPIPTWDGVEFADTAALPTFRTGDGVGPAFGLPAADRSSQGPAGGTKISSASVTP